MEREEEEGIRREEIGIKVGGDVPDILERKGIVLEHHMATNNHFICSRIEATITLVRRELYPRKIHLADRYCNL